MKLPYDPRNFPASAPTALKRAGSLSLTWQDMVWAAITVGKPGVSHLFHHGWHSRSDLVVRAHTIYASLQESKARFARSTLYEAMDPTEKGATSYFLGMAVAKLAASRLLGTPFLFHFSMTGDLGLRLRLRGKQQPDLIGQRRDGTWLVVEAKGRTNGFDSEALAKAKRQTMAVRSINGTRPALRVAAQTFFQPSMHLVLDDPEYPDEDSVDLEVDVRASYERYYSLAYEATLDSEDVRNLDGREYVFRSVPEAGVDIGISTGVRALLETNPILPPEFAKRTMAVPTMESETTSTYPDGLAIVLGPMWAPELMREDPLDRRGG